MSKAWQAVLCEREQICIELLSDEVLALVVLFNKMYVFILLPLTVYIKSNAVGIRNAVDSRYLEIQGTLWNTSRYPYLDTSDLQNWGKQWIEQPFLINEYVIWLLS